MYYRYAIDAHGSEIESFNGPSIFKMPMRSEDEMNGIISPFSPRSQDRKLGFDFMAASTCSKSTRNNPRSRIEAPVNRNLQSARVTLGGAASPVYLDHDEKPPLDRGVSCIRSADESVLLLECRSDRGACMIRSGTRKIGGV
ncbi:hypothetical protein V8C43DRAFT_105815 [Trichoderma afarasin]